MIEIFHVSDLHFKTFDSENAGAKHLLSKIADTYFNPKLENRYLLVTGDVTDSGNTYEYGAAQESLRPFKEKVIITPGNHDYATDNNGWGYSRKSARYFDAPFAAELEFMHPFFQKKVYVREVFEPSSKSSLIIIGLNSCRKTSKPDFACGKIGAKQIKELESTLAEYNRKFPSSPKVLFLHHIPHKDADCSCGMTLEDWRDLMKAIRRKDNGNALVNVLAFGHQGEMEPDILERRIQLRPMKWQSFDVKKSKLTAGSRREKNEFVLEAAQMDGSLVLVLDANNSVEVQAFYHLTWDGNTLVCRVRSV